MEEGTKVEVTSPSLPGCKGIVRGRKFGDCITIEFTDSKGYFKLPCTQSIWEKYVVPANG